MAMMPVVPARMFALFGFMIMVVAVLLMVRMIHMFSESVSCYESGLRIIMIKITGIIQVTLKIHIWVLKLNLKV
jgi:hypothetical protein